MLEGSACVCAKIVPSQDGLYQGAFVADEVSENKLADFEKLSGEKLDIGLKFLAFNAGLPFPKNEAESMAKRNGVIFVKLEPWSPQAKNKTSPLEKLIKGDYDRLLKDFAAGAKKFGRPVFVSFGHEMNSAWYPWSGNPALYIKAYRYVHAKISKEHGACNVTWVWNPDVDLEKAGLEIDKYYPGDQFVDWVAVDGYNTEDRGASWKTCSQLFSGKIKELAAYKKPIMIGEFASDANRPRDEKIQKPQWVAECVDYFVREKRIKAYVYFNVDKV